MIPTLDELLPDYDHRARHERRIAAPPHAVWDALQQLTLADLPLGRLLLGLRHLPGRLAGRDRAAFRPGPLVESPPIPVIASEAGRGLVTAGVSRPWRLLGDEPLRPPLDRGGFVAFDEPGWVKVAVDFRFEPSELGTLASTETRILATDRRARLAFGVYWQTIRTASGLIRQEMLRATAGLAETEAPQATAGARSTCEVGARPWAWGAGALGGTPASRPAPPRDTRTRCKTTVD